MSQELKKKIYLIYGIVLTLLILLVGVCLVYSCLDIYHSGNRPFSRESIGAHWSVVKLPVILCVDTLVGGILLALLLPLAPERTRAKDTEEASLRRLTARLGGTAAPREPRLRHIFRAVTALLIILSGIYPTLCLADSSRFGLADLNGDVIRAVIPVLAATAVDLLLSVLCSYLCLASVKREAEACKRLLAMRAESPVAPVEGALGGSRRQPLSEEKKKTVTRIVQGVLLALAVALILLGVLNGGIDDVLGKAVRICTECIGLG